MSLVNRHALLPEKCGTMALLLSYNALKSMNTLIVHLFIDKCMDYISKRDIHHEICH
jgi:hypothetical protein